MSKIIPTLLKKVWLYAIIVVTCIIAYTLSKSILNKKYIEKEIVYTTTTATEVYMVWDMLEGKLPAEDLWPKDSYFKDKMLWTKMSKINGGFVTNLQLPAGSCFYYWMVQTRDINDNATEVWDTGGNEKPYFKDSVPFDGFFNPGYFIFLAGFIPLLIFYFRQKNRQVIMNDSAYKIKNYIPQLDSIRAIAVLLVIIFHWVPEKSILNFLDNGPLGVNIFFVLSGFLITGILLKSRTQAEEQGLKQTTIFRNFYMRRTLRIFPIYYLLLIVFWFINDPEIKSHGVYYFTYTSNFLFYSQQFFPARLAHLWSLGVEEQFYIIWPWLIILVNRKLLPYLILFFLVVGISSNYFITDHGWWVTILTTSCFDAFATGGFLAWIIAYRQDILVKVQPLYKWICLGVLSLFVADVLKLSFLPARTVHALMAIVLIYYCLFKNNNRVVNYILNNKWLIRIGKISYGVYLYHLFIPELWGAVIKKFASWNIDLLYNNAMPESIKPAWLFIQHFSVLIIICILSWNLIEKPVNKLKKYFEYKTAAIN